MNLLALMSCRKAVQWLGKIDKARDGPCFWPSQALSGRLSGLHCSWWAIGVTMPFSVPFLLLSSGVAGSNFSKDPWSYFRDTVGGITTICFKSGLKSLQMHTQGCQGWQEIINFVRNTKILIARSTIQPKLSIIKKNSKRDSLIFMFKKQKCYDNIYLISS